MVMPSLVVVVYFVWKERPPTKGLHRINYDMVDTEIEFLVFARLRVQYDWVAQNFQALKSCHAQWIFGGQPITDRKYCYCPQIHKVFFLGIEPKEQFRACHHRNQCVVSLCFRFTPSPACQNRKEFCRIMSSASAVQILAHKYAIRPGLWHCNSAGLCFCRVKRCETKTVRHLLVDGYLMGGLVSLEWFRYFLKRDIDQQYTTLHWNHASRNPKLFVWLKFPNALKGGLPSPAMKLDPWWIFLVQCIQRKRWIWTWICRQVRGGSVACRKLFEDVVSGGLNMIETEAFNFPHHLSILYKQNHFLLNGRVWVARDDPGLAC